MTDLSCSIGTETASTRPTIIHIKAGYGTNTNTYEQALSNDMKVMIFQMNSTTATGIPGTFSCSEDTSVYFDCSNYMNDLNGLGTNITNITLFYSTSAVPIGPNPGQSWIHWTDTSKMEWCPIQCKLMDLSNNDLNSNTPLLNAIGDNHNITYTPNTLGEHEVKVKC